MAASITLPIATVVISILAVGIYDVLKNFEENGCEMTYMFQYPEYLPVPIPEATKQYPSYGLFVYGEGSYADQLSNGNYQGIPVLFIPGNAGSYKQVRSLGSVSMRKSERSGMKVHFNYFVVDFNEELSGLYGGVLDRQTEFVHVCIKKILSLYKQVKSPPTSVVLVGHSMGGLVARALFTLPDFDPSLVHIIVTQATPHQRPVVPLDSYLQNFYQRVNKYWKDNSETAIKHVTVVSSGGGHRDVQVRYGLTRLDGIVASDRGISASTTAIPLAWVSTDHLCAVWCRQMTLLTTRALFEVVDQKTKQISTDADFRMKVFQHHFLKNNGLPDYLNHVENSTIKLDPKTKWSIKKEQSWMHTSAKTTSDEYIAVPLVVGETREDSIIVKSNLTNPDWICYCEIPKGQDKCSTCTSISSKSKMLPPLYSNTRYVRATFSDLGYSNDTYVIIIVPAGQKKLHIVSDRYNSDERHLVYQLPNTYDTITSYPILATDGAAMLKISNNSAFYSLHLTGLSSPTTAFIAQIKPISCRRHNDEPNEGSVLRVNVPWSHEDTYSFARYGKELTIPIKLQSGRPTRYDLNFEDLLLVDDAEPHLEMFLHPSCHYNLKLILATQDALGQAARFYIVLVPGYFVTVILMLLRGVVMAHGRGQVSKVSELSPAEALIQYGKPYYIIPIAAVFGFLVRFGPISKLLSSFGVPQDDASSLMEQDIYFRILPLAMYLCIWMVVYMQSFIVVSVLTMVSYIGRLFAWLPESLIQKSSNVQLLVSVIAMLSTFVCGAFGLFFSSVLLILQLLRLLYVIGQKLDTKATHRRLSLLFPVLLLVNVQTSLSLGPFFIWLTNGFKTGSWFQALRPDPTQLSALATTVGVAVLLLAQEAEISKVQSTVLGWMMYGLGVITILYAMESVYRLPIFIALCILALSVSYFVANLTAKKVTEQRKGQ